MSCIDQLITEHCPDGVEYLALGEVGKVLRGKRFVKADMGDQGVPCIHYGEIYTKYGTSAKESISFVTEQRAKTLRFANPGDVIMASAGETIEDIGKSVAWLGTEPIAIHDACYAFSSSMDPVFVAHFFASDNFRGQIRQKISSSKISSISTQNVAKARIPVPSLKIQREIANILDTFSQLEAELEAELDAREQQYAYYRTALLSSFESNEMVALGDIADFKYGYTTKATDSGDFRFLRITDITENGHLVPADPKFVEATPESEAYKVEPGDLLMARTGATFGKTLLVRTGQSPAVYASFLIRIRFKDESVLPSYYWHFAQSELYWAQANSLVSSGSQPQFNANSLKKVKLRIPPLEEQRRVIGVLDKFDVLVNDMTVGLPAEIKARRHQYEYYRDKLLTFQELEVPA